MGEYDTKLEQFINLKEQLTHDLAMIETTIARIEQDYELVLPDLKMRKDALVHALFDEAPIDITLDDHETESATNTQRLLTVIRENPGVSKQGLRDALPDLSETALKQAISYSSKNKIIENRGSSKARPEWYLV